VPDAKSSVVGDVDRRWRRATTILSILFENDMICIIFDTGNYLTKVKPAVLSRQNRLLQLNVRLVVLVVLVIITTGVHTGGFRLAVSKRRVFRDLRQRPAADVTRQLIDNMR